MPQVIERISEDSEVDIEVKEMYTVLSCFNGFLFCGPRDKSQQMQREIERSLLIYICYVGILVQMTAIPTKMNFIKEHFH